MRDIHNNPIRCGLCQSENTFHYDGAMGYESIRCRDCRAECPIGIADAQWTAFRAVVGFCRDCNQPVTEDEDYLTFDNEPKYAHEACLRTVPVANSHMGCCLECGQQNYHARNCSEAKEG